MVTKKSYFNSRFISLIAAVLISIVCLLSIINIASLGLAVSTVNALIVYLLVASLAWGAYFGNCPLFNVGVCIASTIIVFTTNFIPVWVRNYYPMVMAIISTIAVVLSTILAIKEKTKPNKTSIIYVSVLAFVCGVCGGVWGGMASKANHRDAVQIETWQVPDRFDKAECPEKGTLQKIEYQTKAYATDNREVTKAFYAYLPYGYDERNRYEILYLMHGTGDDEAYWLENNQWNKVMLDNLIYHDVIKPTIVITPTFYVEDDCSDDLDQLTYSFKYELRNDLMVKAESMFSTYASDTSSSSFVASRNHRAFAGLSRGAVTTMHSALCGSLDYFSKFGTFSGSRTSTEEYQKTALSDELKDYSIDYWFVASGTFDFALPGQVSDYRSILKIDDRLHEGDNTSMVVNPMRYHSQGNWHIALYNFLQLVFKA